MLDPIFQLDQRVRQRLVRFLHRALRAHFHLVEAREHLLAHVGVDLLQLAQLDIDEVAQLGVARRFGVLDGPTRVTRGLVEPAGV